MAKLVLTDITGSYASVAALNANFALTETALENTLSRDGTNPNTMLADIDLNNNDLLNVRNIEAQFYKDQNGVLVAFADYTGTVASETFSGNGSTLSFAVTVTPVASSNLSVFIDGVYQQKATYTVSGTNIIFSEAPPLGTNNIEIIVISSLPIGSTTADLVGYTPAGTGAVATTVQDKLQESVSFADFGGSPDNTAIQNDAAWLLAYNSNAGTINFEAGSFAFATTMYLDRGVTIKGSGAFDGSGNNGQSAGAATTTFSYSGTGNAIDIIGSYTEGVSNIHLRDFMIVGTVAATGGIFLGSGVTTTKNTLKNLGIFGFTNVTTDTGYGIGVRNCLETVFENVYVHGCTDGFNIGFGACTSLEFRSCYSRVNSRYGWLIQQGNGMSFYQCIAEGNYKTGLVISTKNAQNVGEIAFYSWYSEFNCVDADTYAAALIRTNGTGACNNVTFYSPVFYDSATYNPGAGNYDIAQIKLGAVANIKFINPTILSVDPNFIEAQSNSLRCVYEVSAYVDPANVTGNLYVQAEGNYNVQLLTAGVLTGRTGTWTPTVASGGTGSGGVGQYQRVGNYVTVTGTINVTAITGGATALVLAGLPVACDSRYSFGSISPQDAATNQGGLSFAEASSLYFSFETSYSGTAVTLYFGATYLVNV
jgi:hypothetical protein